jgi:uncharacterized protein (TIGR02099 family)
VKRHAHSFFWFLYWFLAVFIALFAGLCLVVNILVQDAGLYRQDIEKFLSSQLQAKVHLASIDGSWDGWQPVIHLKGLSVDRVENQPGISLGLMDAVIKFDPRDSISAFMPVFSQLDLSGLTLRYDLTRLPENDEIGREDKQDSGALTFGNDSSILAFLLHQRSIQMDKTRIEVRSRNGDDISVSPIQLSLQHDGVLHQLKVDADLMTGAGHATVKFVAEVEGNPSKEPVNLYLKIDGVDQDLLNPWLGLADIELGSLQAGQEIWGRSHRGRLTYLTGRTSIQKFRYQEYALEQFEVHTALIRRDRGFQLQITDFVVDAAASELKLPQISIDLEHENGSIKPRKLMVDEVDLAASLSWFQKQPFFPLEMQEVLKTLSPVGVLSNVAISWSSNAKLNEFRLRADLLNVGIDAWDDVPELKGINGLLETDLNGGEIHLVSDDFAMKYPTLFEHKWSYSKARGVVGWRFEEKGAVVASQLLAVSNDELTATGRFSVYIPFEQDDQPLLNLQIGLQGSNGLQAKYYIPPKEVGEETYAWLVRAIKGGYVNRAGFVLNGVTRARLLDYQLPTVQLFFDVSEASFEYQPGWPAIEKAKTFVFFRDGELLTEATSGKLYDSDVDFAWVHLPLSTEKLLVAGSASGETKDLERLLTESELKDVVGNELDEWAMSGRSSTLVQLDLPLVGSASPTINVDSSLSQGRFNSAKEQIDFTNIEGVIRYDSKTGLSSKGLKASLFQQPVVANIATRKKKTEISIRSSVTVDYLKRWLDLDLLSFVKGKLNYHARVDLCPGKTCNQLVVTSDLKGVEIDALPPFSKSRRGMLPLTLVSDLGTTFDDGSSVVRLNLGNELRAVMKNNADRVEKARFSFGGEKPVLPSEKGIWIDGNLDVIDYAQLDSFLAKAGFSPGGSSNAAVATASETQLRQVALSVKKFSAGQFELPNLFVKLGPQPLGWMLDVDSQDVSGRLWLPDDISKPYRANLRHLHLRLGDDEEGTKPNKPLTQSLDIKPAEIPSLDFSVDSLSLDQKALGQWSFQLRSTVEGAKISNIKANMRGSEVNGELRWVSGADEISDLTVKLDGQSFQKVLESWGLTDSIEMKSLNAYLQLSWKRAPWNFELAKADGELQFTAKSGRILDVGKSGNILRVFGILNLQSLGRRLRLDFTDLVESGVAFDEMKASYTIKQGVAYTTEPFVMTGPSANMAMEGRLDLVNETVDKDIEVALPVTGNIPLVSVLLGAPQVAGAVFLFDKLIGDPLAKFTTVKYHLSGDWGDPSIVIDDGKQTKPPEKKKRSVMDDHNG